nr:hypothetical protein [Candidatus Cryosericum odellii]
MDNQYPVVTKKVPTFYFIGVTTGKSSIMRVFPRWRWSTVPMRLL